MRHIAIAAALATLAFGAALSAAQADNYYGPRKVGNQCYHNQVGTLGYWGSCEESRTAQTNRARATTGRNSNSPAPNTRQSGAQYQ